jgi:hypothetical protein
MLMPNEKTKIKFGLLGLTFTIIEILSGKAGQQKRYQDISGNSTLQK